MSTLSVPAAAEPRRLFRWAHGYPVSVWALSLGLVLYLGLSGGGYALTAYSRAGIVVWWIVVIGAAWRLIPLRRMTRRGALGLGLFAAFTAWTALGITWSISQGRSWIDVSLITTYLGVLVLGMAIHRDRLAALRHTVGALAGAITVLAAIALAARLWPHLIPGSRAIDAFGSTARLAWPLNYWNGVAALMVIGLPLLLSLMTSARSLWTQALGAAAIPLVVLCGALTLSRGGLIAAGVALLVFVALAPERIPKLASGAFAAAGSAALVAGAFHRHALQQGYANAVEHHQASTMLVSIILVCGGVGAAQAGIGLLHRHAHPPRLLQVSVRRARILLAAGVAVAVIVALIIGAPAKLNHVWHDFKNPKGQTGSVSNSAQRLGSASGEGRYQYWVAGIDATSAHVLEGSGPGTFQDLWLPRARISSYVVNAHSLYVETYAELGLVGLALLVGFFAVVLGAAVTIVVRSEGTKRTLAAGLTAAVSAFMVSAAFDWVWQLPVIPACVLLLAAAVLAPEGRGREPILPPRRIFTMLLAVVGLAALVAIGYPLATNNAILKSQNAFRAGDDARALNEAQTAVALESGSAAAQLQLALVLENERDVPAAVAAARQAASDEPDNWTNWLTLSRLEAEAGDARAALIDYRRAKSLNPESGLFRQ